MHIEHGDDNQHKETERGMEDITASRLAAASSAVRAKPARVLTADAGHMQQQDGQ